MLAVSALTLGAKALRTETSHHPFDGEKTDKNIIESAAGSTHRAKPVRDTFNKYEALVSKEAFLRPKRLHEQVYDYFFGDSKAK